MNAAPTEGVPGVTPTGPLAGILVLDLSAYIAGPYGCTLLADQGAEVIKIEPPGGDNLRHYPSTLEGESRAFVGINRNKRGAVLDLKSPQDHACLMRLVQQADVLVHNFRPGVPERLGIDHAALARVNPRLISCAVTGYGEVGPLKDKAGYDQVLQNMTGMTVMQAPAGAPPQILYGSVVDYYASALVAAGVASALYERERSGRGQAVDVSLLRAAMAMQSARLVWAAGEPREVGRDMRSGGVTGIHPTREGYLYLSANTPHFWRALCVKAGLIDLAEDPRCASVKLRAQHHALIVPRLHAALAQRSALEWEVVFGDEVPCAAARTVEDLFDHPQVQALGLIATYAHPVIGAYRGFTGAIGFGRTPAGPSRAAPTLGQHDAWVRARAAGVASDRP